MTFVEFLKIFSIDMIETLILSVKLATPGLLKVKVILEKGHDVMISAHVIIEQKLREGIITSILALFSTILRYSLEILQQYRKSVKTKSQKVLKTNSYGWRSCRRKSFRPKFICNISSNNNYLLSVRQ